MDERVQDLGRWARHLGRRRLRGRGWLRAAAPSGCSRPVGCGGPALPVAQAIGRFGNYFNQELFGRPTTLPWGLHIDVANRPAGSVQYATFHPTFLYEVLWDLGLAAVLIWVVPRLAPRLRPGNLFVLYIAGYTLGRVWIEMLRIDHANKILGLRLNVWTCIVVFAAAVLFLILRHVLTEPPQAGPSQRTGAAATVSVD